MEYREQERFIELCKNARYSKEVEELCQFVIEHKGEYFGGPDAERSADSFALLTAWIYDMLYGKNFSEKSSMTAKVRKVLGYYTC